MIWKHDKRNFGFCPEVHAISQCISGVPHEPTGANRTHGSQRGPMPVGKKSAALANYSTKTARTPRAALVWLTMRLQFFFLTNDFLFWMFPAIYLLVGIRPAIAEMKGRQANSAPPFIPGSRHTTLGLICASAYAQGVDLEGTLDFGKGTLDFGS